MFVDMVCVRGRQCLHVRCHVCVLCLVVLCCDACVYVCVCASARVCVWVDGCVCVCVCVRGCVKVKLLHYYSTVIDNQTNINTLIIVTKKIKVKHVHAFSS